MEAMRFDWTGRRPRGHYGGNKVRIGDQRGRRMNGMEMDEEGREEEEEK